MIPKIIHYCWFGKKEKPKLINKCIESWQKVLVDYEIIEWNEDNFDISVNEFIKEAYECGKFAFVSDYVRVHALYYYGGIYMDTDVEVFKSFNDFLHHDSFWGFELNDYIATSTIGTKKHHPFIKKFLNEYHNKNFIESDGRLNQVTNVSIVTKMLEKNGLVRNGKLQEIEGIGFFYPQDYFSSYDYIDYRKLKTERSYAMHHFTGSWLPKKNKIKIRINNKIIRLKENLKGKLDNMKLPYW